MTMTPPTIGNTGIALPQFSQFNLPGGQASTSGPIVTNLPSTQKSLANKYKRLGPTLQGLPSPIVSALLNFDTVRANRGATPLSDKQTAKVLASAITKKAATPAKERGTGVGALLGNAVQDLGQIAASIPKLPMALFREAQQLPDAPEAIQEALGAGSLSEVLAGLSEAPGVRMLPGAFTVGNIARGETDELLRHPLMTLLDIYPVTKATGVNAAVTKQVGLGAKKVLATPFGQQALSPMIQDFGLAYRGNPGVQFLQQTFGKQAKDISEQAAIATAQARRQVAESPAVAFAQKYAHLTQDQKALANTAFELDTLDTLPDNLKAFAEETRIESNRLGDFGAEEGIVAKLPYGRGDSNIEVLDTATARNYGRKQKLTEIASTESELRSAIIDPASSNLGLDLLVDRALGAIDNSGQLFKNRNLQSHYLRGVVHAIESLGYDGSKLRRMVNQTASNIPKSHRVSASALADSFRAFAENPVTRSTVPDLPAIRSQFTPAARRDPKVAVFLDNLKNGNYAEAYRAARVIDKRTTFRPDEWERIVESTKRLRDQKRYLESPPVFTPKSVARAAAAQDKFVKSNSPARWKAVIVNKAEDKAKVVFAQHPDFDGISQAIAERNYSLYPELQEQMPKLIREVERTWQDLRDEGLDPGFISHVSPESANATLGMSVVPKYSKESWANKRTLDVRPYIADATVAIPRMAAETVQRLGNEAFVNDFIIPSFVRNGESVLETASGSKAALIDDFLPVARRRYPNNPEMVRQEVERLMRKEYAVFDPASFLPPGSKLTNLGSDKMWIPKNVLKNLERMQTPMKNGFTAIMDPAMNMFRTSVLGLSPRFQVNNVVGGGMLAMAEDPGILAYLGKARNMLKSGDLPPEMMAVADKIGIGTGLGQLPREALEWKQLAANSTFQFASGKTLRRLFDSVTKISDKAFDLNGQVDDMYRAAAYLRGEAKAAAKGMTKAEQQAAGVQLSVKLLQKWNRMTPIERTVLRYVMPFYGWAAHVVPYVLQYPIDHPWRASFMSNLTRAEIDDMGSGLPERFLNAFFLGNPDKDGNIKAIQTGGLNPFSGVANYFTWAGFTGNVNPILGSVLEAMGVDTLNGGPELYPDLNYDPESGRLVSRGRSFLPALVGNLIPQSEILTSLLGGSREFKEMMKSNPKAAGRQLLSSAGIPLIYRSYNLPEEYFKAELARESAQDKAKAKALKSGNYSSLNRYPALRGQVAQIQALQRAGKLGAYTPQTTQPSLREAVTP